jgi:hypothetical protein
MFGEGYEVSARCPYASRSSLLGPGTTDLYLKSTLYTHEATSFFHHTCLTLQELPPWFANNIDESLPPSC